LRYIGNYWRDTSPDWEKMPMNNAGHLHALTPNPAVQGTLRDEAAQRP
jgi:hypothetical protein